MHLVEDEVNLCLQAEFQLTQLGIEKDENVQAILTVYRDEIAEEVDSVGSSQSFALSAKNEGETVAIAIAIAIVIAKLPTAASARVIF